MAGTGGGKMKKTNVKQYLVVAFALLLLAGCGVKPRHVDAPAGVSPDPYPQIYPPAERRAAPDDLPERYLPDNYKPNGTTAP